MPPGFMSGFMKTRRRHAALQTKTACARGRSIGPAARRASPPKPGREGRSPPLSSTPGSPASLRASLLTLAIIAGVGKPRILVTRRVPQECLDLLKPHFEIEHYNKGTAIPRPLLLKKAANADGLLCLLTDKVNEELLARAPQLK